MATSLLLAQPDWPHKRTGTTSATAVLSVRLRLARVPADTVAPVYVNVTVSLFNSPSTTSHCTSRLALVACSVLLTVNEETLPNAPAVVLTVQAACAPDAVVNNSNNSSARTVIRPQTTDQRPVSLEFMFRISGQRKAGFAARPLA